MHSRYPTSASGSPTVASSQSNTALTASSLNAKLPGFGSPCTSVIVDDGSGRRSASSAARRSSAGRWSRWTRRSSAVQCASSRSTWSRPASAARPTAAEIDAVDRRERLDEAAGHLPEAYPRVFELGGERALVDRAVEPFHHVELASEHVAGGLVPERARGRDGCGIDRSEDRELAVQVVGLEEAGWRGPRSQHDVTSVLAVVRSPRERQRDRLGGMADGDVVEAFDRRGRSHRAAARRTTRGAARSGSVARHDGRSRPTSPARARRRSPCSP